jgi:hypothetical protein
MWHRVEAFWVAAWVLVAGAAAMAMGDVDTGSEPEPEAEPVETVRGEPVDHGFVILGGEYLPPPYVVSREGDDLLVNDRLVAKDWFAAPRPRFGWGPGMGPPMGPPMGPQMGPGFRRGFPPGRGGPGRNGKRSLARVEQRLDHGAMLISLEERTVAFVDEESAIEILEILLSGASNETKAQSLVDQGIWAAPPSLWPRLVECFQPTPELKARAIPLITETHRVTQENEARHEQLMLASVFRSKPVSYAVTVVAMGLGVIALGSLLSYRPDGKARWRDMDTNGEGVPMVVRNVVLLVLLGLFDLALTVLAQQTGGFLELNPLGSELAESPALLAGFKVTTLLAACLILLMLRRYRAAQAASWWLCLICTVLTFRWLTYNSMFLA